MTPIVEVWLTKKSMTIRCMVINEDESGEYQPVASVNMRGAQREVTRRFTKLGYMPVGRWNKEAVVGKDVIESMRLFRSS